MKFAGIDFDSNRIDVVTIDLDTDSVEWFRFRIDDGRGEDAFSRARRVREAMPARTTWADFGVIQIAIEDPRSSFFRGAIPLARIQGAILATLPRDVPVMPLEPHEWKQALGLPGSGKREKTKREAREYALDHGAPAEWPQDAFDAFCIARAAITIEQKEATAA